MCLLSFLASCGQDGGSTHPATHPAQPTQAASPYRCVLYRIAELDLLCLLSYSLLHKCTKPTKHSQDPASKWQVQYIQPMHACMLRTYRTSLQASPHLRRAYIPCQALRRLLVLLAQFSGAEKKSGWLRGSSNSPDVSWLEAPAKLPSAVRRVDSVAISERPSPPTVREGGDPGRLGRPEDSVARVCTHR